MMKFISKEEKIFYYILSCTLIIDIVNGFLISITGVDGISLGMIARSVIIIICIKYINLYSKKLGLILYMVIFPFILTSIISFYTNNQTISSFMYDIKDIFIILYYISMLFTFIILTKNNKISENIIYKIIINNSIFLFLSIIIINVFDIGLTSYEGGTGFKGTFHSLNALSSVGLVLFTVLYDNLLRNRKSMVNLILFFSITIFLLMVGAKSIYMLMLFIIFLYSLTMKNFKIIIRNIVVICIGSMILFMIFKYLFYNEFIEIIKRQLYFLDLRSENLITYLLSSRDLFLKSAIDGFNDNFTLRRLLIGLGAYAQRNEIAQYLNLSFDLKSIEMDIFDMFYTYGILGIITTYGTVLCIIKKKFKYVLGPKRVYFIAVFVVIIYSILGGHVFTEALSITFLNICLLGIMSKSEIYINEDVNK